MSRATAMHAARATGPSAALDTTQLFLCGLHFGLQLVELRLVLVAEHGPRAAALVAHVADVFLALRVLRHREGLLRGLELLLRLLHRRGAGRGFRRFLA